MNSPLPSIPPRPALSDERSEADRDFEIAATIGEDDDALDVVLRRRIDARWEVLLLCRDDYPHLEREGDEYGERIRDQDDEAEKSGVFETREEACAFALKVIEEEEAAGKGSFFADLFFSLGCLFLLALLATVLYVVGRWMYRVWFG